MSVEIQAQFSHLKEIKTQLLSNISKLQDLNDDESKISIFNLLNSFEKALQFIARLLEFEFAIDLTKQINFDNDTLLYLLTEYDESAEFLTQFKKNFIQKQFDLKNQYLQKFERKKLQKFGTKEVEGAISYETEQQEDKQTLSSEAKVIQTTKKITSKLTQSSQILQSSLVQSQLNLEELTIQNDSLSDLADKYGYLKGVLERSDSFINDLKLSSERDKKRMYYALIFFGLCIFKVWWSRILKLPFMFLLNVFLYTVKLLLATFGLISNKKAEVDFVANDFTDMIDNSIGVISSTPEIDIATESDVYKIESAFYDGLNDGNEFETELEKIIDKL